MWTTIAAVSGALAVLAGAFGAHALRARLEPAQLDAWTTATHYHLLHSVALLAIGLAAPHASRSLQTPCALFLAGMLLFSGSIYALALGGPRWLGPITPIGGLCLIAGWGTLAWLARP